MNETSDDNPQYPESEWNRELDERILDNGLEYRDSFYPSP